MPAEKVGVVGSGPAEAERISNDGVVDAFENVYFPACHPAYPRDERRKHLFVGIVLKYRSGENQFERPVGKG